MKSWIICFFLVAFFILPSGNILYALYFIFLIYSIFLPNYDDSARRLKKAIPFIIFITFSFLLNIGELGTHVIKESVRILSICGGIYLFPYKIVQFDESKISKALFLILAIIVISQFSFVFHFTSLVNLIDKYYPYDNEAYGLSTEYYLSREYNIMALTARYTGIYRNPNQFARYLLLGLSAFIFLKNNIIIKLLAILICGFSILLAGSRTGTIVYVCILIYWLLFNNDLSKKGKRTFIFLILPFILYQIYVLYNSGAQIRSLEITAGVNDSFKQKLIWFSTYLFNIDNIKDFFIGHGTAVNVDKYGIPLLDSEWGMLFFSFGIIGLLLYIYMIYSIYKDGNNRSRAICISLIWIVSSTVFFAYRMFILFFLVLSLFYRKTDPINHDIKY